MTERRPEIDTLLTEEYRLQAELDTVHARLDILLGGVAIADTIATPRYRKYGNLLVLTPRANMPEGIA